MYTFPSSAGSLPWVTKGLGDGGLYLEPLPRTPSVHSLYLEPLPRTPSVRSLYLEPLPRTPSILSLYLEPLPRTPSVHSLYLEPCPAHPLSVAPTLSLYPAHPLSVASRLSPPWRSSASVRTFARGRGMICRKLCTFADAHDTEVPSGTPHPSDQRGAPQHTPKW